MHVFSPTEDAPSSLDAVNVLETAITITDGLSTQEADAAYTVAESQGNIDASEKERARNSETITARHAEQDQRATAVGEARRAQPEELREKLQETPYELELVKSLTLDLPNELLAEIFDWHMLMGGRLITTLLVCKRWTLVAYRSPRLWSRISVSNLSLHPPFLRGSVRCTDLDHLRLVLSRSRSCTLQLELHFRFYLVSCDVTGSSSSLIHGPHVAANRITAVKMILDDQILRRCTSLLLVNNFLPFDHLNVTVLPLLSSIQTHLVRITDRELLFIQSLVNLSPSLRHLRSITRSLSAENQGVGLWTKRIESYSSIFPYDPCNSLHESPSLRWLEVFQDTVIPLTLPALQVLKWSIGAYSALHRITAPRLHTLVLHHGLPSRQAERQSANSISFPNLRVAIHASICDPTVLHMFHTPALEHLSIEYRSSLSSPSALLELFNGWAHMPRPKSLHLDCTFTDTHLISLLSRLPWLEELKVAGKVLQDTFWEGMAPSCNSSWQVSPTDERATRMLVPNLKVLLVNYPTCMRPIILRYYQPGEWEQVSNHLNELSSGREWTMTQIFGVAEAREQAGCPLRTLACWVPEKGVNVLIGGLDGLSNRPRFVSLTAL